MAALDASWPVAGANAAVESLGAETELLVKVQDQALTVVAHGRSAALPGSRVHLAPQPQQAHLF